MILIQQTCYPLWQWTSHIHNQVVLLKDRRWLSLQNYSRTNTVKPLLKSLILCLIFQYWHIHPTRIGMTISVDFIHFISWKEIRSSLVNQQILNIVAIIFIIINLTSAMSRSRAQKKSDVTLTGDSRSVAASTLVPPVVVFTTICSRILCNELFVWSK